MGERQMSLFDEIQSDIVSDASLTTILRKAKILAYRINNPEFKSWVDAELSGYRTELPLPSYRKLNTHSKGTLSNLAYTYKNVSLSLIMLPDEIRDRIQIQEMREGIKELESLVQASSSEKGRYLLSIPWKGELIALYNSRTAAHREGYYLQDAHSLINTSAVEQILDSVRNRLLGFILELAERYPEQAKAGFENVNPVPNDQVRQVFEITIMGSGNIITPNALVAQGGNVSIFDQRNQSVGYQFNAAGNINFESVKTRKALVAELQKLKTELSRAAGAKVIKQETATSARDQITKAIQQSRKTNPDKKRILQHINEAKALVSTVSSAAGLVTALAQAIEQVQKLFR